jgi:hypothetical protein
MGLVGGVLTPVFLGMTIALMAPATFLKNPFLWLDAISKSGATISGGPGFAYDLCVRKTTAAQRATLDLSCWSLAFIGAEAVGPRRSIVSPKPSPVRIQPRGFLPCTAWRRQRLMVTGPKSGTGAAVRAFSDKALSQGRVEPLPDTARMPAASSDAVCPSVRFALPSSMRRPRRLPDPTESAKSGSPAHPSARVTGTTRKKPRPRSTHGEVTTATARSCAPAISASSTRPALHHRQTR